MCRFWSQALQLFSTDSDAQGMIGNNRLLLNHEADWFRSCLSFTENSFTLKCKDLEVCSVITMYFVWLTMTFVARKTAYIWVINTMQYMT